MSRHHLSLQQSLFPQKPSLFLCGLICVIMVLYGAGQYDFRLKEMLYQAFVLTPEIFQTHQWYRFISYGLLHHDHVHLLLNMVWLFIFSVPFLRYFGKIRFLVLLAITIMAGGFASIIYESEMVHIIGISAGVSGVMGASLRFMLKIEHDFRKQPILLKFFDLRYLGIVMMVIATDIIFSFAQYYQTGQNIAWQAHMVGMFTGGILMSLPFMNKKALYK